MTFKHLLPAAMFMGLQIPVICDPSITDIYKSTQKAYDNLSSYSDDTISTGNFDGYVNSTHYEVRLERPTFYQISWISKDGTKKSLNSDPSGVWFINGNSLPANENSLYGGPLAWKVLLEDPQYFLLMLPNVFFNLSLDDPFIKKPVANEKRLPDEVIDGSACFVLVGKGNHELRRTMWIRKKDYLILKTFDEGVMGQIPATAYNGTTIDKGGPLEGSTTETHSNIKIKELDAPAITPAVPVEK